MKEPFSSSFEGSKDDPRRETRRETRRDPGRDPIHVLEDGPRDPAWNMALDDALLHVRQRGAIEGTWVRLFGWTPPAVSIGRLQSPVAELDWVALAEAGVPVVRRSTGGKAVYHADELTYSVVGGVPDATWGTNLHETYRGVTAVLADALLRLGVTTQLAPRRRIPAASSGLEAACFAVAYGHELVHAGRKICGSAQRRLTRAFLQHGSLLIGPEQARMGFFLRGNGEPGGGADRAALAARLRAETVDVTTAVGRPVRPEELAQAVRAALIARFGPRVVAGELPPAVILEAESRLEGVRVAPPARAPFDNLPLQR
jgi:lipoate-protein ligase A